MSQIRLFRAARAVCLGLGALATAASCTSVKDDEDYVPSQPGAVQPTASGTQLSESAACERLTNAEDDARSALRCKPASHSCPADIRPAGGADCFMYDEGSIDACAELYQDFTSCDAFDQRPCLITATSSCAEAGEGGQGGEGGVSGATRVPSEAGNGGASGDAGAGG